MPWRSGGSLEVVRLNNPGNSIHQAAYERIAYEVTEHYRITRDFLANPQRMLKILFEP